MHYRLRGLIICVIVLFIALCIVMATSAKAYDGEPIRTAKQEALHQSADILRAAGYTDDSAEIKALSDAWWQQQEDLNILAKVIWKEANAEYCQWEHSVAVGVVVLNRVASPYFANTVRDVVAAPGQYLPSYTYGFDGIPRICYEAAKAAMDGDHDVPSDCYWQDNKVQGVSIWKAFVCDTGWFKSTTYICRGIPGVS